MDAERSFANTLSAILVMAMVCYLFALDVIAVGLCWFAALYVLTILVKRARRGGIPIGRD